MKTINEKLMEEFSCAITAILGDVEDLPEEEILNNVSKDDLQLIAKKVSFYLFD